MFFEIVDLIAKLTVPLVSIIFLLIVIITYFRRGAFKIGNFNFDFRPTSVDYQIEKLKRRFANAGDDPGLKQYVLLREYHAQGLAQSKISFWFSLVFASLGFLVIIGAIVTLDNNSRLLEQGRALVTLVSGVIIDAVSALFFVQSNKARELMVEFFDKLRSDRKLEESLRLAEEIPDIALQSKLKSLLSLNFADIAPTDSYLLSLFGARDQQHRSEANKLEAIKPEVGVEPFDGSQRFDPPADKNLMEQEITTEE